MDKVAQVHNRALEIKDMQVQKLREKEMLLLRTEGVWAVASSFVWIGSPLLVSLASFAAFTWSGNELKPHIAFTALSLFNVLRMPLFAIPQVTSHAFPLC